MERQTNSNGEQRVVEKENCSTGRSDINYGTALWEVWLLDTNPTAVFTKDGGKNAKIQTSAAK
jgi:hypothetical protein